MSRYSAVQGLNFGVKTWWYVVANRVDAVIYADAPGGRWRFVERLRNPEGDRTELELDSDRPGSGGSGEPGAPHHPLDRRFHKHETVARGFAASIVRWLDAAVREERFAKLVLVAEPRFLGMMHETLSPALRRAVAQSIGREFAQGSDAEIRKRVVRALARS